MEIVTGKQRAQMCGTKNYLTVTNKRAPDRRAINDFASSQSSPLLHVNPLVWHSRSVCSLSEIGIKVVKYRDYPLKGN